MKTATWMLAAALSVAGCTGAMMSDPDRMRSLIDDLRLENEAHRDAAVNAASIAELRDEMTRHDGVLDGVMSEMEAMMDGMSHCTGGGMQAMRGMHDDMMGEMDAHGAAMEQASDLDAAATELGRHAGAMHGMVDGMDAATGTMGCRM